MMQSPQCTGRSVPAYENESQASSVRAASSISSPPEASVACEACVHSQFSKTPPANHPHPTGLPAGHPPHAFRGGGISRAGSPPMLFPQLGLDLGHARNPAVVIVGLTAHVVEHLRVRQNQKRLTLDAFERILRHLRR